MSRPLKKTPSRPTQVKIPNKGSGPPGKVVEFPVVGIGASAGGLDAFKKLLGQLPVDLGMAYVLIQHLDPIYESNLPLLLSKSTQIPVLQVETNTVVQPDTIYVIPPAKTLTIENRTLKLSGRSKQPGTFRPIDHFLKSLARDVGDQSIGVILSGTGSDGTRGIRSVKEEGGISFAQDSKSSQFDDMPRNAIVAGGVDFVLPPEKISEELARISRHPYLRKQMLLEKLKEKSADAEALNEILCLLQTHGRVDFSKY